MERNVILMDFDGVIGKFDAKQLLKIFPNVVDKTKLLRIFVHMAGVLGVSKEFKKLFNDYQAGQYSQEEFIEKVGSAYPNLRPVLGKCLNGLPETLVVYDDTVKYLQQKKQQGCEIYIVTNDLPENKNVIQNTVKDFSDGIFYSTEMKSRKNKKEVFENICKVLKVAPQNTIFVDDKQKYVDVAAEANLSSTKFDVKDKNRFEKIEQSLRDINNSKINAKERGDE